MNIFILIASCVIAIPVSVLAFIALLFTLMYTTGVISWLFQINLLHLLDFVFDYSRALYVVVYIGCAFHIYSIRMTHEIQDDT